MNEFLISRLNKFDSNINQLNSARDEEKKKHNRLKQQEKLGYKYNEKRRKIFTTLKAVR